MGTSTSKLRYIRKSVWNILCPTASSNLPYTKYRTIEIINPGKFLLLCSATFRITSIKNSLLLLSCEMACQALRNISIEDVVMHTSSLEKPPYFDPKEQFYELYISFLSTSLHSQYLLLLFNHK